MKMVKNGGRWKLEVICVCWKKGVEVIDVGRGRSGSIWVDLGVLGGGGVSIMHDVAAFFELDSR